MENEIVRCPKCRGEYEATQELATNFCPRCRPMDLQLGRVKPLDEDRLKGLSSKERKKEGRGK